MKNSNPFHQILKYGQKIFGLSDLVREYDQVRPGKQIKLAWGYQQSTAGETYRAWLSAGGLAKSHPRDGAEGEMAKQNGELTVFKKLLSEITSGNGGKLPFDIIVGDGLYDKAPVLQEVERCGAVLIAVHKDARRILHKDAEEEFTTRIPEKMWSEMKRVFEGWSGVFIDQYISRTDQTIKIIRVVRRHNDGTAVDNYFYCSNKTWITPRLAEWCRHYRWKEENGFNAWTNDWNLLKHVFHHTAAACDAMIGFIFITIIVVVNYQKGNLRRGGRTLSKTLKTFFRNMTTGFGASKKNIGNLLHEYLQATGID